MRTWLTYVPFAECRSRTTTLPWSLNPIQAWSREISSSATTTWQLAGSRPITKPLGPIVKVRPMSNPEVATSLEVGGEAGSGVTTRVGPGMATVGVDSPAAGGTGAGEGVSARGNTRPQLRQKRYPSSFVSPHPGHLITV